MLHEKEAAWQGDPSSKTCTTSVPPYPRRRQGDRLPCRRKLLGRIARLDRDIAELEADRARLAAVNAELAVELEVGR